MSFIVEKFLLVPMSGLFIVLSSDFMLWGWQILSSHKTDILVDSRETDNEQMAKEINKIILFRNVKKIKLGYMTTCVSVCVCVCMHIYFEFLVKFSIRRWYLKWALTERYESC